MSDSNDILRFEHILYYREERTSLNDVTFTLGRGENLIIFGPEDSGAEIVCPLIAGVTDQFGGEVIFNGRSIKTFNYVEMHNYRKELGYLQRDYGLINNMSVVENISLPLKYHTQLTTGQIGDVVNRLVEDLHLGYCRNMRPVSLSGAAILKTAYARAIALDPELLLVEHALEGQCLLNSQTYMRHLRTWSSQPEKSVIIVTYEPERFIDFSDRFIMLYEGEIVFSGSREDFVSQNNDYLRQYCASSVEGPMKVL